VTSVERLEMLEKELKQAKRGNRWMLVVVVFSLGISIVALLTRTSVRRAATVQPEGGVPTEGYLYARAFIIEDENGKIRAMFGINEDGPALGLCDEKGVIRAGLSVYAEGPSLDMYDDKGAIRAGLAVRAEGPSLDLYDDKALRAAVDLYDSVPSMGLYDENGSLRAAMAVSGSGDPSVGVYDDKGGSLWRVP
jgi:hypothetical protein